MSKLFKPTKLALAVAALALPFTASANQSLVHSGYTATTGGVVNEGTVNSSSFNPAGNNLLLKSDEKMRFGYLSNLGFYVEIGETEDLDTKIDDLVDDMDALDDFNFGGKQALLDSGRFPDLNNSSDEADFYKAVAKRANDEIIPDLEKGGQFRLGGLVQVPLTPFLIRSSAARGTFSINASASFQAKGMFLGDNFGVKTTFINDNDNDKEYSLDLDLVKAADAYTKIDERIKDSDNGKSLSDTDITYIKNILDKAGLLDAKNGQAIEDIKGIITESGSASFNVKNSLITNSGLDVQAAIIKHISVGYGTNLSQWLELDRSKGELEAGARLNIYNAELGRKFVSLEAEAESDDDSGNDTSDNLTEGFTDNTKTSTAFGLDLGFLWHSNNYQAGITFYNLNEPSFDYPDLSAALTNSKYDKTTLNALKGLESAGKIKIRDKARLKRHAVVEGAYFNQSRSLMLQGAYTLGTATDFVGDEHQNLHLAAGYYPKTAWIPGLRAGYSKNFKGSELSKLHAGATFFGVMHLDLAMATQSSSFDDSSVPRYLAFSLGFEEKF